MMVAQESIGPRGCSDPAGGKPDGGVRNVSHYNPISR